MCVKAENFDGIAYLTNYCEKHGLDMGDWDANNCRNLVNNCLNEKFDMSRVMVFNKFYIYRNKCRLATANMMYNNKTNDKKFGEHLFG